MAADRFSSPWVVIRLVFSLREPAGGSGPLYKYRPGGSQGHRCGGKVLFCIAAGQDVFPLGGSSQRNSDLPVMYYLLIGCVPMVNLKQ
jgi:hypothetical protein